jgi:hypothetical protein
MGGQSAGEQPLRNIHGTLRLWSCAVVATALLLATQPAAADNSGGSRICEGPYALCSSAVCQAMAGDQTHVKCACEGPLNGLNIGDLSCKERTERLTSTFSLLDITSTLTKPAKSLISCAGENKNVWAFCRDAPCSADKGRLSCTCQLNPSPSDYVIFASACLADNRALRAACAQIWSSASQAELMSSYSQLAPFYGDPAKLAYCPPIGSPSPPRN